MERHRESKHSNNFSKIEKKKQDKKKYINLKLNNKIKVQQWEQRRQKTFQRRYKKELNRNHEIPCENTFEQTAGEDNHGRLSVFKAAQIELQRRKEEKKQKIAEKLQKRKEIEQAISNYKKKKAEKFKKLSKKTKRGQPVMKDRLQLLCEEIKHKVSNENT